MSLGLHIRYWVRNDEVFFTALRKLLPPYEGPPGQLFRGQSIDEPVGVSWTDDYDIAFRFAFFDPSRAATSEAPLRPHGVLLAGQMHHAIICAPCLHGYGDREYVVDPRDANFSTEHLYTTPPCSDEEEEHWWDEIDCCWKPIGEDGEELEPEAYERAKELKMRSWRY